MMEKKESIPNITIAIIKEAIATTIESFCNASQLGH